MEEVNPMDNYFSILEKVKNEIALAQFRVTTAANRELLLLYWNIGKVILENSTWGNKFIENLSRDIKVSFPEITGFSVRNLKYMKKLAQIETQFVQGVLAQIPWYSNIALMDKIDSEIEMIWYAKKTIENGWSRNVLVHQIESKLYERQVLAEKTTNFGELILILV